MKTSYFKKCFSCKKPRLLFLFSKNRRQYNLPADIGRCKCCNICELKKALKTLSVLRFDFDIQKYKIIHFKNKFNVLMYFVKPRGNQ